MAHRHQPMPLPRAARTTLLPHGQGRSYGDSNLNPGGALLFTHGLDRLIGFDAATGVLRCESGTLLDSVLRLIVPQGWFLPVTPGTKHISVGGAIANDVHGKNHHWAGSFGNHVRCIELLRSDGTRRICAPDQNPEWFVATIGGLGLTGLITWAEIQCRRIANPLMTAESIRFRCVEEFFELSEASAQDHEYTVSWIDCSCGGKRLGRGLFNRANHAPAVLGTAALDAAQRQAGARRSLQVPFAPPVSLVNGLSLRAFNTAYYLAQRHDCERALTHFDPFFYPLDKVQGWNRLYGRSGFFQYQSVIPDDRALQATRRMLEAIARSGMGSPLAVLKRFGTVPSRGMLSFPQAGTTLALDFPNRGQRLERLLRALDDIVRDAGGRLYPAKDGRLPASMFQRGFPLWQRFSAFVDPRFSSALWRRVSASVQETA